MKIGKPLKNEDDDPISKTWRFDCATAGDDGYFDLAVNSLDIYNDMTEEPCKHGFGVEIEVHGPYPSGCKRYEKKRWRVPLVVIAYNEGGYNCTAVCVDCLLEAADALRKHLAKK